MKNLIYVVLFALLLTTCRDKGAENAAAEQQRELDSIKLAMEIQQEEMVKQRTIDSMNVIANEQSAQLNAAASVTNAGSNSSGSASTTPETKKKGWSSAAKGAVIGAGVGAVTGAVISKKKKGQGALIGGAAGAILGAGTGAVIDENKKAKEAEANQ